MSARSLFPLKFFGAVSLGLLTGISITFSSITIPALLALPSAIGADSAFALINARTTRTVRSLTSFATICFLTAYTFSPRSLRHPYLLWTSLVAAGAGTVDLYFTPAKAQQPRLAKRDIKGKGKMEASYEVLGDSVSEVAESASEDEDINGEEVRAEMLRVKSSQIIRSGLALLGFGMSLVGLWGDARW